MGDEDTPDATDSGAELDVFVQEAEFVDEPADDDVVDGEVVGGEIEPWVITDDPHAYGQPEPLEPEIDHSNDGARPGGGGGNPGGGGGMWGGKRRRGRRPAGNGGSGGGINVSIFGGLFSGASVVKTGAIGSGSALWKGRTGSGITGLAVGTGRRPAAGRRR